MPGESFLFFHFHHTTNRGPGAQARALSALDPAHHHEQQSVTMRMQAMSRQLFTLLQERQIVKALQQRRANAFTLLSRVSPSF